MVANTGVFDRAIRWWDTHTLRIDSVSAALTLLVVIPLTTLPGASSTRNAIFGSSYSYDPSALPTWVGVGFSILIVAPLAIRRKRPVLSAVVSYSAALLHLLMGISLVIPADMFILLTLYSITVHGPRWAHRVAIVGALVGSWIVALELYAMARGDIVEAVIPGIILSLMFVVAWSFGLIRRSRRERLEALTDRATQLERERDQQAQLATAAERNRIAREMHDIVAHSLSVVIAQADGGRYAAAQHPEAAVRALETISETGRAALGDMRRLLGVLRADGDLSGGTLGAPGPHTGEAESMTSGHTPQPGLAEIETLMEQVRNSGAAISLVTMGSSRTLPPGAGLAVYRVCQESLTNVLKHAGPHPTVSVVMIWRSNGLALTITDDGRGASALNDGAGHGVLGMRERATMFQGTLAAGPQPGGGYRVRLEIPYPARSQEEDNE